jgi:hypothetical protein
MTISALRIADGLPALPGHRRIPRAGRIPLGLALGLGIVPEPAARGKPNPHPRLKPLRRKDSLAAARQAVIG